MNKKQKKSLKRIVLSAVFLFAASILSPLAESAFIKIFLFIIPYFIVGHKVLKQSFSKIISGQMMDENFLMSIATIGAFVLGEYLEAVAVMLFFNIGELFESYAVGKSRKSIASLMDIRPEYANVIRDGQTETILPEEILTDDILLIKPGERIPVDGIVIEGSSSLDTSALTGEPAPRDVDPGSDVISGCINISGAIKVKAIKTYVNSTVSKILALVENSSLSKSKSESFITRFARVYTPIVVGCAAFLAFIVPIFAGNFALWFEKSLIFLVVSCPCALVISVPLSFFSGIGAASKNGILVKGSSYLEKMSKISEMVFDKTGTLTKGSFTISKIKPMGIKKTELLELAAAAESCSSHPIALSIQKEYGKSQFPYNIAETKEIAGCGIVAKYGDSQILAGNSKLMEKFKISYEKPHVQGSIVHIALGETYKGYIVISDTIKEKANIAVSNLKKQGIMSIVMLTGDKDEAAKNIAEKLGIDKVHSELLPHEKVEQLKNYINKKPKGRHVAFAGDGINDAPVLAAADVGIAMGAMGSDAAIEASDIVLMDDDISKIPLAVKISRETLKIVKENIIFSLSIKLGVMLMTLFGMSNMWQAVFADVGVSVIAILNAMRALKIK